ncbi:MAG: DNA-processing protein DprA [Marinilabiliales bacterium]|nr:DNA-processing protein DprA [Marinilabiliales bacterium]
MNNPPDNADEELIAKIALSLVPGIGCVTAKSLIAYCGDAAKVFQEKERHLRAIPGIGTVIAGNIHRAKVRQRAEKELEFIRKNKIRPLFYLDPDYPQRLKSCIDAPLLLFCKGDPNLNFPRVISIVGTRKATEYGRGLVDKLVASLAEQRYKVQIISGLAYGIDIQAHKSALHHGLSTVCVLAHGLETVYPSLHKSIALEMCAKNGGMVSDFPSHSLIDRKNFLRRNRIIAGMADVIVVVESACKGGALLTAELANSYNRDVFAFPGRVGESTSEGTHFLIKTNRAGLIERLSDIECAMNWQQGKGSPEATQPRLFDDLTPNERMIADLLRSEGELPIDQLSIQSGLPISALSSLLLALEFSGVVKCLPGKVFRLL